MSLKISFQGRSLCLFPLHLWPCCWPEPFTNGLEKDIERRNSKNPDKRCEDHTAKHRRTNMAARELGCAGRDHKRKKTEDECKRCHHHRAESQPRALSCGIKQGHAFLSLLLGEFHNENSVFRCKAYQHHHADLRVESERKARDEHGSK